MFKLAEKKLREELKKKLDIKKDKDKELQECINKLRDIDAYEKSSNDLPGQVGLMVTCILLFLFFGAVSIACIDFGIFIFAFFALVSLACLGGAFFELFCSITTIKEIKELKRKGVKKFKKQIKLLKNKENELGKEIDMDQDYINKINTALNSIQFFYEAQNEPFCLADTEEELMEYLEYLETIRKTEQLRVEELWNAYLEEKVNYEDIHLVDLPIDMKPYTLERKDK